MVCRSIDFSVFILLLGVAVIDSTGKISVKVNSFQNPSGRDKNGNCCDGLNLETSCPTGKCDNSFSLCISNKYNSTDDADCFYGKHKFSGDKDQNSNTFTDNDVTLFVFDSWKGGVSLIIRVTDSDSDGENDIDLFSTTFTSAVSPSASNPSYTTHDLIGSRQKNPTSLSVAITAYCDKYYYRSDCSKRCVPQDDCNGHYTCSNNGDIVCNKGWNGTNCQQEIPGSEVDCSVYDDLHLEKTSWSGNVSCVNFTQMVDLQFTGNGGISGDFRIQGERIHVFGRYNSTTHEAFLTANADNTSQVDITSLMATRTDISRLIGIVILNGETCGLELSEIDRTFLRCGYGNTCVWNGPGAGDYYCCCNDGTMAHSCGTPTTTIVATTTTTPTTATTIKQATNATVMTTNATSTDVTTGNSTSMSTVETTTTETTTERTTSLTTNTPISSTSTTALEGLQRS